MPTAWSEKRERQFAHVKESLEEQGRDEDTAEEIAARTVNRTRVQEGEAEESSPSSRRGASPAERGGRHSHRGPQGRTRDELYEDAKRLHVPGRSSMDKAQLEQAVHEAEDRG